MAMTNFVDGFSQEMEFKVYVDIAIVALMTLTIHLLYTNIQNKNK